MKIKKYTAPSMPEAMKVIRRDLGVDAVILNSKEVEKGGFLGFFTKKSIEVTAAVDPDAIPEAEPAPALEMGSGIGKNQPKENIEDDIRRLQNEIRQLNGPPSYPAGLSDVNDRLREQQVDSTLAESLMKPLVKEWYKSDESLTREALFQSLYELLCSRLAERTAGPFNYEKKYLLLAGPTGVGKTTTLAKIAAKAQLEDQKKIAFMTADTYRIAAVDQLKAYADILDAPMEVAYTKEDFLKAKETFADRDLVLIDTAGRNFQKASYINELQQLIPFGPDTETWLVLSMTSKYEDMKSIFQKFTLLAPNRCVLTKVDETRTYGAAVNFWLKDGIAPAFLTNGQNVPDDLIKATPEQVADMLSGVMAHE